MAHWRLHYHLIWTTYGRAPLIGPTTEKLIHSTLYGKAKELSLLVHAVGGIEDHMQVGGFDPATPRGG